MLLPWGGGRGVKAKVLISGHKRKTVFFKADSLRRKRKVFISGQKQNLLKKKGEIRHIFHIICLQLREMSDRGYFFQTMTHSMYLKI